MLTTTPQWYISFLGHLLRWLYLALRELQDIPAIPAAAPLYDQLNPVRERVTTGHTVELFWNVAFCRLHGFVKVESFCLNRRISFSSKDQRKKIEKRNSVKLHSVKYSQTSHFRKKEKTRTCRTVCVYGGCNYHKKRSEKAKRRSTLKTLHPSLWSWRMLLWKKRHKQKMDGWGGLAIL